jgi:hypothetical protein
MKNLLILERSESNVKFQKTDSGDYILEGIFSEIGKKNKNNRVYDEAEFIPHVEELAKLVEQKKVLGELDHPKNFEISLKNVSHVIEEISYNKANKQVRGKIKLLDTDAGKQAKALVDAGVPIHISSRAAGQVSEGGHVKVKRLFTYDLVADPGFENAQLSRVNESYGFDLDNTLGIFEMDETIPGLEVIKEEIKTKTNTKEKMNETKDESFVSMQNFDKYSNYITDQFKGITEKLDAFTKMNEAAAGNTDNADLTGYVESIAKEVNVLAKKFNSVDENVDNLMAHNDYIVESMEDVKNYAELVALKTDQGIEYSKELAESVDQGIEYTKSIAENVDTSIEYQKRIVEETNQRFQYQSKINESVDGLISHNDYIVESMEGIANFTEYLKENVESLGSYTEQVVEGLNENFNLISEGLTVKTTEELNESAPIVEETVEEIVVENNDDFKKKLNDQIYTLIESAKTQKAVEDNKDLHFLNFVTETRRNEFESLNESEQGNLIKAFSTNKYFGTNDVTAIWESVINPITPTINWLENMPSKYQESFANLNESAQETIKLQASVLNLDSQYKIDHFWSTRDLRSTKVNSVNESQDSLITESKPTENTTYMDAVTAGLKSRFKGY